MLTWDFCFGEYSFLVHPKKSTRKRIPLSGGFCRICTLRFGNLSQSICNRGLHCCYCHYMQEAAECNKENISMRQSLKVLCVAEVDGTGECVIVQICVAGLCDKVLVLVEDGQELRFVQNGLLCGAA
jgi:hypothetical protein